MPKSHRSEIEELVQNILPILHSQYDYPAPEDKEHVKIQSIPIRIGGSPKKPDCVCYWKGIPVLLIEAKKEDKTEEDAQDQAFSYIKNYPVGIKEYSKNGKRPRFVATTIGKDIKFYECKYELVGADFGSWLEEIAILDFKELLAKYGLSRGYKPRRLSPLEFRDHFLLELAKIYSQKEYITKNAIYKVALQIISYLENEKNYTSREPYVSLDNYKHKQAQIRYLFNQYDIIGSLTKGNAKEFREFVLRAFQGTALNQYMTEQCIIDFMVGLIDIKPSWKVLDFECGSGGFLAAAVDKGKVPIGNIKGIDIDPLPVAIAKTYLTIYFKRHGKSIDAIPILEGDGLKDSNTGLDLVTGNPAGSKRKGATEYSLAIRHAIESCKVGGKICLLLPEGFFSNEHDKILRKYVAKFCKILAIIGLPRGIFRKGRDVKKVRYSGQTASMKMSVLYVKKIREVIDEDYTNLSDVNLHHPIFLASIAEPKSKEGEISDWLKPRLDAILKKWLKSRNYVS